MKKLLALILTLCMVLSVAPVTYAEEAAAPAVVADVSDKNEAQIVTELGIMKADIPDTAAVTRAQFISYVISILVNTENKLPDGQVLFSDVDASHEHAGAIYNAMKLGLVNGSGDGAFNPDSPISWDQAIKILVSALGYGIQAEETGGYPVGYLNVARERKITRGIDFVGSNPLSNADCKILLYRALTAPYVKLTAAGNPDNEYSISKDGTWLLDYMHVRKIEGVVKETGKSSLSNKSNIKSNQIRINNELLNDVNILGQELLGYSVVAFAADDRMNDLMFIVPAEGKNEVLTIDARDLLPDDFTLNNGKGKIVYADKDGKKQEAEFSNADIIYNGVVYKGATYQDTLEKLKIDAGSITLLDSEDNDGFVIIVEEFETYVVHNVTKDEQAIYSKYPDESGNVQKVTLAPKNENVIFKLVDMDMNEITIDNVVQGSILSVYESDDSSFIRIVCSNEFVTGTVTHKNASERTVSIDGEPYNICLESFAASIFDDLKLGEPYKFYINERREIVEYELAEKEGRGVAFLHSAAFLKGSFKTDILRLKFFTDQGEFITADCDEYIILDGERQSVSITNRAIINAIPELNDVYRNTLFEYVINEEGKITELDFPYTDPDTAEANGEDLNTLRTIAGTEFAEYTYRSSGSLTMVGAVILVDADTTCFDVPKEADRDREELYSVKKISFANTNKYTVKAFGKGKENKTAKYVVQEYTPVVNGTVSTPAIILNTIQVLNEEGEAVEAVNTYTSGAIKTYNLAKGGVEKADLEEGDITVIGTDGQGNLAKTYPIFDATSGKTMSESQDLTVDKPGVTDDLYAYSIPAVYKGPVYEKSGTFVTLSEDPTDTTKIVDLKKAPVYVYDSTKESGKKVTVSDQSEILDIVHNGEPSTVVIYVMHCEVKFVMIIK